MNRRNNNSVLWLSLLLNATLIVALFIVCIEYKANISELEQRFAHQAQLMTEMSQLASDAASAEQETGSDINSEIETDSSESQTTTTTSETTTTTTTTTTTRKVSTTRKKTTTTSAATTTAAPTTTTTTTTTTAAGDNDASTPEDWTDWV